MSVVSFQTHWSIPNSLSRHRPWNSIFSVLVYYHESCFCFSITWHLFLSDSCLSISSLPLSPPPPLSISYGHTRQPNVCQLLLLFNGFLLFLFFTTLRRVLNCVSRKLDTEQPRSGFHCEELENIIFLIDPKLSHFDLPWSRCLIAKVLLIRIRSGI